MNKLQLTILLISLSFTISAENREKVTTIDSLDQKQLNWYNLHPKKDRVLGAGVNATYQELLPQTKIKKTIVVAVIDGGVDVHHEDLKGKIWTNPDEVPGNGIDDDQNGYVDDVHGWNFLGNADGENINYENYEYIRIIRKYQTLFEDSVCINEIPDSLKSAYKMYWDSQTKYQEESEFYYSQKEQLEKIEENIKLSVEILKPKTLKDKPLLKDIKSVKPSTDKEKAAKKYLTYLLKKGFDYGFLNEARKEIEKYTEKHLNLDYNARSIIGDDLNNLKDAHYGNPNVKGPDAGHGTFVAGIIAANRNNNMGINGIADSVKIMALRSVPNGDEYDKDIALSIIYAVDNGADIINMSFGKDFSPNKPMVDKALKYAEEHGVLMVHASGNNAENNDEVVHYPHKTLNDSSQIENWLTVGAIASKKNKKMVGVFSNYGQQSVDIFAPGVDVVSLSPENTYDLASGTSFSAPVVTGVAALIWSCYPELTAQELKHLIIESSYDLERKKVFLPNVKTREKTKLRFGELSSSGGIVSAYNAFKLLNNERNKMPQ